MCQGDILCVGGVICKDTANFSMENCLNAGSYDTKAREVFLLSSTRGSVPRYVLPHSRVNFINKKSNLNAIDYAMLF